MALLDFLKRKKEIEKTKKPAEKKAEKVSVTKEKPAEKKISEPKTIKQGKKASKFSYSVIKEPHISEKATYLIEKNAYVFKVYSNTNKPEIKKSVEGIYGVNVISVNTITIPPKKRRIGRTEGFKKGYTKAIVTIKEGQKIEIF